MNSKKEMEGERGDMRESRRKYGKKKKERREG